LKHIGGDTDGAPGGAEEEMTQQRLKFSKKYQLCGCLKT
jgi:hypothetical protein